MVLVLVLLAVAARRRPRALDHDRPRRRRRRRPGTTTPGGAGRRDGRPGDRPATITAVSAFDPDGDGEENDDQACGRARRPATRPRTGRRVCYLQTPMGKDGVGLVVTLSDAGHGRRCRSTSATRRSRSRCSAPTPSRSRADFAGWGPALQNKTVSDVAATGRASRRRAGAPPADRAARDRPRPGLLRGQPEPRLDRRDQLRADGRRPRDDRELVAAAQAGDRRALDTLLRRHYDRVHAVCRRIAGSSRDADDAAQEAMISIVRGLPRFDGRAAVLDVGRTASPPTPPSTSCAGASAARPCTSSTTRASPPRPSTRSPSARRRRRRPAGDRRRPRRAARGLPRRRRAARRRRPRLRRDRRGARRPGRHRQVAHRPRPLQLAAALGNRDPPTDVQPRGVHRLPATDPRDPTMTDDQLLLASAYVDDDVDAAERARAEADPEVMAEVARLRRRARRAPRRRAARPGPPRAGASPPRSPRSPTTRRRRSRPAGRPLRTAAARWWGGARRPPPRSSSSSPAPSCCGRRGGGRRRQRSVRDRAARPRPRTRRSRAAATTATRRARRRRRRPATSEAGDTGRPPRRRSAATEATAAAGSAPQPTPRDARRSSRTPDELAAFAAEATRRPPTPRRRRRRPVRRRRARYVGVGPLRRSSRSRSSSTATSSRARRRRRRARVVVELVGAEARRAARHLHSAPMAGNPLTDPNWAADLADTVERVVGTVRDRATKPAVHVTRGIVFGLLAAFLGVVRAHAAADRRHAGAAGAARPRPVARTQAVYLSYLIVGGILCLGGSVVLPQASRHRPLNANGPP